VKYLISYVLHFPTRDNGTDLEFGNLVWETEKLPQTQEMIQNLEEAIAAKKEMGDHDLRIIAISPLP
jgi:hypothetical protein